MYTPFNCPRPTHTHIHTKQIDILVIGYGFRDWKFKKREAGSDHCSVCLVSGLYGQGTKVDGWAIRPKEAEETSNDPMELSVEEAMHLHAIKAEMLCPKM